MNNITETNREIVKTIFDKLGGIYQVNAMIGIKELKSMKNGLQFQIHCKGNANFIRIVLNDLELYDVEFGNIHTTGYLQKSLFKNIYCDDIKKLIEDETGLYLSL